MTEARHRTPTLFDVAREAGVSKSSAARVLAGVGAASPKTRERVLAAAERLGYRTNALAKAVRSGSSHLIGAVVPDAASPFFSVTLRGLTDAARAAGFDVIVTNTDGDPEIEARSIELLVERRVDGLVIAPAIQDSSPRAIVELTRQSFPIVLLDRRMPALKDIPLVAVDNIRAIRLAVDHLIDSGHRGIAIVTDAAEDFPRVRTGEPLPEDRRWRPATQRLAGYVQAMDARGVAIEPAWVIGTARTHAAAKDAVTAFLHDPRGATAILCTDAQLTYAAYQALVDLGVSTPEDLAFVGFDDQDWTTVVRPPVTVVDQPRYDLGAAAANLLLSSSEGAEDVVLSPYLIERGTSAVAAKDTRIGTHAG